MEPSFEQTIDLTQLMCPFICLSSVAVLVGADGESYEETLLSVSILVSGAGVAGLAVVVAAELPASVGLALAPVGAAVGG